MHSLSRNKARFLEEPKKNSNHSTSLVTRANWKLMHKRAELHGFGYDDDNDDACEAWQTCIDDKYQQERLGMLLSALLDVGNSNIGLAGWTPTHEVLDCICCSSSVS